MSKFLIKVKYKNPSDPINGNNYESYIDNTIVNCELDQLETKIENILKEWDYVVNKNINFGFYRENGEIVGYNARVKVDFDGYKISYDIIIRVYELSNPFNN